jgi:hypothetical protein
VSEQMELMRMEDYPERPDLLDTIAARPSSPAPLRWRHTGERFFTKMCADGDLAEQVCSGLACGCSVRLLARRLGVSPKTLAACRRLLTERGELAPVRRRVDALLDEFVEEGFEYGLEGMRTGVSHPASLSIPVLAAYDKMAQRDAGLVSGTDRSEEEITVERVNARLELMRQRKRATEEASGRENAGPTVYTEKSVVDTGLDTAAAASGAAVGGTSGHAAQADGQAGGGDRPAAPHEIIDGSKVDFGQDKRG